MSSQYEAVPTETVYVIEENSDKAVNSQVAKNNGPIFGKRHQQVLMHGSLLFLTACIRSSMSIGIVAMNDPTASINPDITTFEWKNKGAILSCFFWGSILPELGSGWLANRYGPKWFLVGSSIVCAILDLLLPTAAYSFGSEGVMVCRVLQGFAQGIIPASLHGLLGKWVPPHERSGLGTLAAGGATIGAVVITFTSGYLAASWYGWPMIFYLNGGLGFLWSIIFTYMGSNTPAEHSSITHAEQFYIENSLPLEDKSKRLSTPWLKIFTSGSFLALLLAHCGYNWGLHILMADIPSYFKNVMKLDIKSNGALSTLPHIVKWIMSFLFSVISDMLISKSICSIGTTRKVMHTIGSLAPCLLLIILGNSGPEDASKAVVLLIVTFGFLSANISGFLFNHLDLSPNHAAVLMGITSQFGSFCTAIGLTSVQYIVVNEDDPNQWGIVFYLTSGIFIVSTVIFCFLGSGEVQPWNDERVRNKSPKKEEDT
ncbi:putative inorganic phosphate cotransporter [Leptinotarsa decemlineata]|uniref:putative inorganic phosphate cotransporter n=1 Tax=Leptinotarsa decemlineata TaxID=7539 RepID=UPI003D304377